MFANTEPPTSAARRNRGDDRGGVAARQAETPEWTSYRIRIPEATRRHSRDGVILETVHHVVHVPTARRILEDNRLRAGLIYDESRLNRSRMCVTWVSANTWGPGSIYGNIQFSFAWSDLIRDRRVYWVEAMPDYSPRAYRLLLTDRDLSASRHVTPYDPASDEGPLRERDGVWYWNDTYTSEFMIDADLPLRRCTGFAFINHRPDRCRLNGSSCTDRTAPPYRTGGRVLAFLLGNDLHGVDRVLKTPVAPRRGRPLSDAVDVGIDGIMRALGNNKSRFAGGIWRPTSRQAVLRGALALYGADRKAEGRKLISLLKSQEVFEKALTEIVNDHFGINNWTLF